MPTAQKKTARKPPVSDATKVRRARQIASQAINEAAQQAADQSVNRSTRTRTAYKTQADALQRVARVLSGKE
jgi:hypothetical protein